MLREEVKAEEETLARAFNLFDNQRKNALEWPGLHAVLG